MGKKMIYTKTICGQHIVIERDRELKTMCGTGKFIQIARACGQYNAYVVMSLQFTSSPTCLMLLAPLWVSPCSSSSLS